MSNTSLRSNDEITATQVRLVKSNDEPTIIMSLHEAKSIAEQSGLDIIQLNDEVIPTCKLIDLVQFVYTQKKLEKEQKKKQRKYVVVTKEIQLSLDIQSHDIAIKQRQVQAFLSKGNHVKINLRLTGRSRGNVDMQTLATEKVESFINDIGDYTISQPVTRYNDIISVLVKPKGL